MIKYYFAVAHTGKFSYHETAFTAVLIETVILLKWGQNPDCVSFASVYTWPHKHILYLSLIAALTTKA